jgi:putative cell wall-binding protein
VFVATGTNYPDALAAGPAAGAVGAPLILVDGTAKTLSPETASLISDLGTNRIYIVGGTGAVGTAVEARLGALIGPDNVHRLAGSSRWATAAAVDDEIFPDQEQAVLANGNGFADALAGAPLAGAVGGPMYLAPSDCLPSAAAASLLKDRTRGIWLVGGTGVLSAHVANLEVCDY